MSTPKVNPEKDLFGHLVTVKVNRFHKMLAKADKATFEHRVERLEFVESITGHFDLLGDMETVFIIQEAGWTYINGAFISTILLSQAFIERKLYIFMASRGFENEAKHGAQAIIDFCRQNELINNFLLEKFDRLRVIRNPFVHIKPYDHPFNLVQRAVNERTAPEILIEKDAKDALSLMYEILLAHF